MRKHGGTVIAQNEETCEELSMPRSAIQTGRVDLVLTLDEIGPTLVRLVTHEHISPAAAHGENE